MVASIMPSADHDQQPRKAERRAFAASIQCRRGMTRETIEVLDISTSGAKVRALFPMPVGQQLWLRLPRLEPSEARVVWTVGCESGCEFVRALHPAVFDAISQSI